jgi:phage terminase large subunit
MVDLKLLPSTIKVIKATKPTILFIGGRGSSKSYSGSLWTILQLVKNPGVVFGCFSPSHSQTSGVMLPNLINHLDNIGIKWTFNKKPDFLKSRFQKHDNILSMNIPGSEYASQIFLGTADSYDFARGREFFGLWLDEVRDISQEARMVFLGCLRGFGERIYPKLLTTTPNGYDDLYNEYIAKKRDDVEIINSASQDNIFLPKSFFEELKNNYSEKFYAQEVLGQIINFTIGQVVYAFKNSHISDEDVPGDNWLGCDFNLLPMSWCYGTYNRNKMKVIDEIIIRDTCRTQDAIDIYTRKNSHLKGKKIIVVGDSSGNAGTTKSYQSDYDIIEKGLREAGMIPVMKPLRSNPSHVDRANLFNKMLEDNKIIFSGKIKQLIEDFHKLTWKEGTKSFNKAEYDAHAFDACSYFAYSEFRPQQTITMGKMSM